MASSSHSTPKRRRVAQGDSATQYQASPAARALNGIRSWLSPWRGAATRSAAFGASDDEQGDDAQEDSGPDDSIMAADKPLYPPLPEQQRVEDSPRERTSPAAAPFPFTFTSTPTPATQQQQPPRLQGVPSPLSRNYDILSRFFAEKAAAESGQEGSPSGESKLTEEEVRGCIDLIHESGAHPDDVHRAVVGRYGNGESVPELPVRRRNTVRRSWLSPAPSHRSMYDADSQSDLSYGGMSFSPDRASPALFAAQSPPPPPLSTSYLAPRAAGLPHSSTEPASLFAQSLTGRRGPSAASTNPFLTGSTSVSGSLAAPKQRRRRPLYLGPGFSSSAGTSVARRRTVGQASTNSQLTEPAATTTVGLGKRQRVADDSQHVSSMDLDAPPTSRLDAASPPRTTFAARPTLSPTAPAPAPSPRPRQQSSAATAALSILQDSDLPKPSPPRKSAPRRTDNKPLASSHSLSSLSEDAPAYSDTSFRPDTILNPYQAAPGLKLGKSVNGASSSSPSRKSRSSEALEKMKNERRKSTRSRKQQQQQEEPENGDGDQDDASTSQGLLAQIERTRPSSMRTNSKTPNGSVEPPSTPKAKATDATAAPATTTTTPTSTPPAQKGTDKTMEARRRLEAMKASSSSLHAHAPGKPSRLSSIAFNANESPSSTGSTVGDDDEDEVQEQAAGSSFGAPSKPFSFGSASASANKAASPPASKPFSFGTSSNGAASASKSVGATSAPAPAPAPFTFSEPVAADTPPAPASAPEPFSFSKPAVATSKSAPAPASFSFAKPVSQDTAPTATPNAFTFAVPSAPSAPSLSFNPAPLPPLKNGKAASELVTTSTPTPIHDVKAEAASKPVTALVTFDLSSRVLGGQAHEEVKKAAAKGQAKGVAVEQLPRFELLGAGADVKGPVASAPTPATAPSPAPAPAPSQPTDDAAANEDGSSSTPTTSALLGSGEGEEDETTEFEVRAKFWKFVSGKWEDVGVGIAKVKSRTGSTSRRLLVRNSGNGAVSVNFNLVKDFSATQQGSSLSFTGFDAQGKGLPMRCKVKTEDSAAEFKGALEGA